MFFIIRVSAHLCVWIYQAVDTGFSRKIDAGLVTINGPELEESFAQICGFFNGMGNA